MKYTIYSNASDAFESVQNHENEMTLCSVWLTETNHQLYALTSYLDEQCLTLLVPRQKTINLAAIIFLSLNLNIWISFGCAFVCIIVALTIITRLGIRLRLYKLSEMPFRHWSTAFIAAINTTTAHGVHRFPSQTSIKFAVVGWIIFTFLFSVIYTSGYVSLFTYPPRTEPIESAEQLMETDLKIVKQSYYTALEEQGIIDQNPIYKALANRFQKEHSAAETLRLVENGECAFSVAKLSNQYIANIPLRNMTSLLPMQLMKKCIVHFFVGLAFAPHSPYNDYFTYKLQR